MAMMAFQRHPDKGWWAIAQRIVLIVTAPALVAGGIRIQAGNINVQVTR